MNVSVVDKTIYKNILVFSVYFTTHDAFCSSVSVSITDAAGQGSQIQLDSDNVTNYNYLLPNQSFLCEEGGGKRGDKVNLIDPRIDKKYILVIHDNREQTK